MSTRKIELSVGAIGIGSKYDIFTKEEIDNIDKIPELDERIDIVEDEMEESLKFEVVGEGAAVPDISGVYDDTEIREMIDEVNASLDNKAMLVNSTDWINLKEFGAKMDGVTDDSDVFQEAVNISNKNTVIFIGSGNLYLGKSIYLDNKGERIVLNIQGNNSNISGHQPQNSIQTKITCSEHFLSKVDGQVMPEVSLKMSGVLIQQKQENENFNVFNKLELKGSDISNISTINFGSVIKGSLTFTSRFHHNTCLGIMRSFLENENLDANPNLVDSQIHNNYLNGKPGYNAVCFNLGFTQASLISDNFIDVFKYVYTSSHVNVQNVKARGNLYDLCYKLCEKNMFKCTFNHETFMRFSPLQVSHTNFTGVVDEEYGIFVKISLENVCVSDCIIGEDVANFYVYSNVNAITDRFIIFNNNRDYENPYRNLYDFTVYQENGRHVFSIDNNKPIHVTDLTISRPSVAFYNGQQVIYNNRVLRYYEYKFYNLDGSEFK